MRDRSTTRLHPGTGHPDASIRTPGASAPNVTREVAPAFYGSGMEDAELVVRVLEGEVEAFTILVDRYYDGCGRFALRMLGNRQDAEDALQETFLSAYRGLGRYRERQAFRGWLYRILVNRCRSAARQRRRRDRRFVEETLAVETAMARQDGDPELRDALQLGLEALDPLLREAFLLKHGEGLDYHEMSALTGAGVSALKMRVKRACDALRPRLEERDV
jgi:RNA polymerase sigma-70 factor, ECF subfamily